MELKPQLIQFHLSFQIIIIARILAIDTSIWYSLNSHTQTAINWPAVYFAAEFDALQRASASSFTATQIASRSEWNRTATAILIDEAEEK